MADSAVPSGLAGNVSGLVMATLNRGMAGNAVELLALRGDERVLDIGFGPGVSLEMLNRSVSRGAVAGIDPSEVMFAHAQRRNRRAIQQGRIDLRVGTVDSLPWPDSYFDAVCALNTAHLWVSIDRALDEIRRVLRTGASVVIGASGRETELRYQLPGSLRAADFTTVRVHERRGRRGLDIFATATA